MRTFLGIIGGGFKDEAIFFWSSVNAYLLPRTLMKGSSCGLLHSNGLFTTLVSPSHQNFGPTTSWRDLHSLLEHNIRWTIWVGFSLYMSFAIPLIKPYHVVWYEIFLTKLEGHSTDHLTTFSATFSTAFPPHSSLRPRESLHRLTLSRAISDIHEGWAAIKALSFFKDRCAR